MIDDATGDDLMYESYVRQAIEAGIADLNAGRKVSTDELRREFGIDGAPVSPVSS